MNIKALAAGISAFMFWGFIPLFWKQIQSVPAYEIMSFRVICALLIILIIQLILKEGSEIFQLLKTHPVLLFLSSALIATNWLVYVWAVNTGHIVETSIAYYINPLINVFLSVVFLKERLRKIQWFAIFIAATGVGYIAFKGIGAVWISLVVAGSFALYGLVRKKLDAKSLVALGAENIILTPFAIGYLIFLGSTATMAFPEQNTYVMTLTALSGLATLIPLSAFGFAVKNLSLTTIGLIQYLAPTFQLLIGVLIYGEAFTQSHIVCFSLIWIALIIYSIEGIYNNIKNEETC